MTKNPPFPPELLFWLAQRDRQTFARHARCASGRAGQQARHVELRCRGESANIGFGMAPTALWAKLEIWPLALLDCEEKRACRLQTTRDTGKRCCQFANINQGVGREHEFIVRAADV